MEFKPVNNENENDETKVTAVVHTTAIDDQASGPSDALNPQFMHLNEIMAKVASRVIPAANGNVFAADLVKGELFAVYLASFPEAVRQRYNCHCCRRFLNEVGGLVCVDADTGATRSVLWDETTAPTEYAGTIQAMRQLVESRKIAFIFRRHDKYTQPIYGKLVENGWTHLALPLAEVKPADAFYAAGRSGYEEYKLLAQHQADMSVEQLTQAETYFENDPKLQGYPQHLASIKWWLAFKADLAAKPKTRKNLMWLAASTQGIGRLRMKTKVVGEFMADMANGASFENARAAFLKMVDPRDYQRPKTDATAATIKQAEDLVNTLNLGPAMERRSLAFEEIPTEVMYWQPPVVEADEAPTSVFGHLTPADAKASAKPAKPEIDGGKLTLSRFLVEVMPNALSIRMPIQYGRFLPWSSLVTAVHPDAEPIIAWDIPERRNPVSSFTVTERKDIPGSRPHVWKLPVDQRVAIKAIVPTPERWYKGDKPSSIMLILDAGTVPVVALGLFPEILRPELHPVRKVMEQYSNAGKLANIENGVVALGLNTAFEGIGLDLYVDNGKAIVKYHIDRGA